MESEQVYVKEEVFSDNSFDGSSKLEEDDDYYDNDFIAEDFVQVKLESDDANENCQSSNIQGSKNLDENTDIIEIVESGVFNHPGNQPLDLKAVSIVQSVHSIHLQRNKYNIKTPSQPEEDKSKRQRKNKKPEYYVCQHCGKYFKNNSHYHRHVRLHTTGRSHKCEECGKYYTSKETLIAHAKCHTEREPEDPVTCPLCQTVYKHAESFRRHYRRRHINAGIFQCQFCDKICSTKEAIKKHLERHKNVNSKFPCTKCEKIFVEFSKLKLHLQTHEETYKFTCDKCSKRFIDEKNLKLHIKSEHQERPFICQICNHDFNSLRRLKAHINSHFREKKYLCHLCPKAFDSNGTLEDHIRLHNGELPFKCDYCEKKFAAKKRMRCHMTIHHREHLFSCPFCSMVFVTEKSLETHKDTHKMPKKSFCCKECGKIFIRETYLKQHMKLHNKKEKYKCEFCNKQFRHKISIKKHQDKSCIALKIIESDIPDKIGSKNKKKKVKERSSLRIMSMSKTEEKNISLLENNSRSSSKIISNKEIKMCNNCGGNSSINSNSVSLECDSNELDKNRKEIIKIIEDIVFENSGADLNCNKDMKIQTKDEHSRSNDSKSDKDHTNENIKNVTKADVKEINFEHESSRNSDTKVSEDVEFKKESSDSGDENNQIEFSRSSYFESETDYSNTKDSDLQPKLYDILGSRFTGTNDSANFGSKVFQTGTCEFSNLKNQSKINNQDNLNSTQTLNYHDFENFAAGKLNIEVMHRVKSSETSNVSNFENHKPNDSNVGEKDVTNELDNFGVKHSFINSLNETPNNLVLENNKFSAVQFNTNERKNLTHVQLNNKEKDEFSKNSKITQSISVSVGTNLTNKPNEKSVVSFQKFETENVRLGKNKNSNFEQYVAEQTIEITKHPYITETSGTTYIEYKPSQGSHQIKLNFPQINDIDSVNKTKDENVLLQQEKEKNIISDNSKKCYPIVNDIESPNSTFAETNGNNNSNFEIGEIKYKLCDSRNYANRKNNKPTFKRRIDNGNIVVSSNASQQQNELIKEMLYTKHNVATSNTNTINYGIEQNIDSISQLQYKTYFDKLNETPVHIQQWNDRNVEKTDSVVQNNLDESRNYSIQQYHKIKAKLYQMESDSDSFDSDTERQIKKIKLKRLEIENSKHLDRYSRNEGKESLNFKSNENPIDCSVKSKEIESLPNVGSIFQKNFIGSSQNVQNLFNQPKETYPVLFANDLLTRNYIYSLQHQLLTTQNELSKISFLTGQNSSHENCQMKNSLHEQTIVQSNVTPKPKKPSSSIDIGNYSNSLIYKDNFKS